MVFYFVLFCFRSIADNATRSIVLADPTGLADVHPLPHPERLTHAVGEVPEERPRLLVPDQPQAQVCLGHHDELGESKETVWRDAGESAD